MLPIPELLRVARLVDDGWRCELAERAAARWGAADALFVRSSASHVFFAQQSNDGARIVLRMRPESPSAYAVLHRSATAAERLSAAGAPVVSAVRSSTGALVESVDGYLVTAVAAADGEIRDEEAADRSTATDWGAALAEVHAHGAAVDPMQLPDMVELCAPPRARDADGPPMDSRLSVVADEVAAGLAALPRDPLSCGLLHGDAELDNVVFTSRGPVLVDLDDVRTGWRAADVGFALRSWAPMAAAPDLAAEVPAAFIAGYRSRRPLTDQELSRLPLFARAAALETLWELQPLLAHPVEPSWPAWATTLDARIRVRADELSAALCGDLDM
jgi:Ser/Thr protein kinase RdoA (MazF antagonist)